METKAGKIIGMALALKLPGISTLKKTYRQMLFIMHLKHFIFNTIFFRKSSPA